MDLRRSMNRAAALEPRRSLAARPVRERLGARSNHDSMSPEPYWSTYSAPFCRRIVEARVRSAVKIPKLFYDGKSDPMEHIKAFSRQIELFTTNTDVICKTLATSFTSLAQTWFDTLAPGTITSLSHLCTLLEQRFSSSKKRKMTNDDLFNVQ